MNSERLVASQKQSRADRVNTLKTWKKSVSPMRGKNNNPSNMMNTSDN